jgi:hypothetical protein
MPVAGGDAEYVSALVGALFAGVGVGDEPRSYKEAVAGSEAKEWQAAIGAEMQSIRDHGVWDEELVELPPGKKAIDLKFVFRKKTDAQGNVVQHKARLVARGFTQVPGQDFGETFAPVGKFTTGRVLLGLAAVHGWHVHQMDVVTAFLNGRLEEEIYVQQPEGHDDGTGRVYRLRKALYGLKQAPRVWNTEIGGYLTSCGFTRSV